MLPVTICDTSPDTLRDICLLYCVTNTDTFSSYDPVTKIYNSKDGVSLPLEICESLIHAYEGLGNILDDNFMHIFKDNTNTHLRQICVQDSNVTSAALQWLIPHRPTELNISGCSGITEETLHCINQNGKQLIKLFIGDSTGIIDGLEFEGNSGEEHQPSARGDADGARIGRDFIFYCPEVRAFSIQNLDKKHCPAHEIIRVAIKPFRKLTYLDLSHCVLNLECIGSWENSECLTSLILHNVQLSKDIRADFQHIAKLKNLRSLDLSQATDDKSSPILYSEPEENLRFLVSNLPNLLKLDLSGTNLAGFQKIEEVSHRLEAARLDGQQHEESPAPIPGLEGRHLEFLGLLNCPHDASHRKNLPADKVTGDFKAEQVIYACQVYLEKPLLLVRALQQLIDVFKHLFNYNRIEALLAVLTAMRRHAKNNTVQLSASACLFYLLRDELDRRVLKNIHIRKILHALFDAMENHSNDRGVRRNCVMTILNMDFPADVIKDHRRLFKVILLMIGKFQESGEDALERRSFHVLNNMAVEVDLKEKETFGDFGGIQTMIDIVNKGLLGQFKPEGGDHYEDRIEDAWTVLWNYSDETPKNCERFLDSGGMDLFLHCFKKHPKRYSLMRNMMGLMGNVAEVKYLRPRLMKREYIDVYTQMLPMETHDGIELNYHACGVLAHIMSDGPGAWTLEDPTRDSVRRAMLRALNKWSVAARRHINYRSFKPLLRLVPLIETPISQHWAVWALRNLIGEYRRKYCELLHQEGGLTLLHRVVIHPDVTEPVKKLATKVLEISRYYFDDDRLGTEEEENPPPLPF